MVEVARAPEGTAEGLSAAVKARAAALGFDACGIAAAGVIGHAERLDAWLACGYHASMEWLLRTKERRRDIREVLPGAASVVVVARNYFARRPESVCGAGRVSRYAWGQDYHEVLAEPVRALATFIGGTENAGAYYASVDSGPVAERAWGAQAGLGWIGKNGLLIHPELGSWLFLGVIATTVPLTPDAPVSNRCGDCTRCIDACPTRAIVAPGTVDARACISYHTVENRGAIPEALADRFGDWVFGCDACQESCPWNEAARETSEQSFLPRARQAWIDPLEVARMDETEFRARFAGTPLFRRRLAGLRRNADIVARNNANGGA